MEQFIGVDRLVRTVESADADMEYAGPELAAVVSGHANSGIQSPKTVLIERNSAHAMAGDGSGGWTTRAERNAPVKPSAANKLVTPMLMASA